MNGGYRNDLYTGLQQNNCGVDYVGTQSDQNTRVADRDHEGHPGFTIGDIAGSVNTWTATTQPNIILLMIGTNDTAWWTNENAGEIGTRHNALIEQSKLAQCQIFGRPFRAQIRRSFNPPISIARKCWQQLDAVIAAMWPPGSRRASRCLCRRNSVLTTADLYDGIHPTEAAHAKVAQVFLTRYVLRSSRCRSRVRPEML